MGDNSESIQPHGLLCEKDIARELNLSVGSVRNQRYAGRGVKYFKLDSGAIRYSRAALAEYLKNCEGR